MVRSRPISARHAFSSRRGARHKRDETRAAPDHAFAPAAIEHGEAAMNLKISGHHLEVTPALREYVVAKLERVLRHFDQVIDGTVLLAVDNHKEKEKRQRVEVNLHLKGKDIFVESANGDLYAAIDMLIDKLDRQVLRYKDRLQGHQHEAIKYVPVPEQPAS
ncbi:Ribosome-associated factor Y [Mycetohabitans rhizoxinica HKI 454]|uniref:Ribosome hibernation promoting factor n=2 Tax=Mycetohabitans rhizoxinica TaxID=412963 RepID=E5ALV2_MYCRK|nr:Ribosome-associated factor Y [Mycetohabitans rhizoxinica HKI 454]